jgi:hypothetical protein
MASPIPIPQRPRSVQVLAHSQGIEDSRLVALVEALRLKDQTDAAEYEINVAYNAFSGCGVGRCIEVLVQDGKFPIVLTSLNVRSPIIPISSYR